MDSPPQLVEHLRRRPAGDLGQVDLLDAITRMRKAIRQFAVVGDQDQPFAVQVEPADSEQANIVVRHQVDHAGPAGGVAIGRHHAFRLVHGVIDPASERERLAIDADFLGGRIDPRAELRSPPCGPPRRGRS